MEDDVHVDVLSGGHIPLITLRGPEQVKLILDGVELVGDRFGGGLHDVGQVTRGEDLGGQHPFAVERRWGAEDPLGVLRNHLEELGVHEDLLSGGHMAQALLTTVSSCSKLCKASDRMASHCSHSGCPTAAWACSLSMISSSVPASNQIFICCSFSLTPSRSRSMLVSYSRFRSAPSFAWITRRPRPRLGARGLGDSGAACFCERNIIPMGEIP